MVGIAHVLNVSKQSVHQWENKKTAPSADKLVELADYFDVSIDYLVGRSDVAERRINSPNALKAAIFRVVR